MKLTLAILPCMLVLTQSIIAPMAVKKRCLAHGDLTAFADCEEFLAVRRYLHRDEADPELIAQDVDSVPAEWYTEGFMSREEFDLIQECRS